MSDLFVNRENNYNLECTRTFNQTNSKIWSRNYFLQGTSNMEPEPGKIKDISYIKQILKRNKKWKCDACPYRICKMYIQHVGFINKKL